MVFIGASNQVMAFAKDGMITDRLKKYLKFQELIIS